MTQCTNCGYQALGGAFCHACGAPLGQGLGRSGGYSQGPAAPTLVGPPHGAPGASSTAFAPARPKRNLAWKVGIPIAVALAVLVGLLGIRAMSSRSRSAADQTLPKVVQHVALEAAPLEVAASPDGNVYVSYAQGQPLSVVSSGKVVGRVAVGSSDGGLAVAFDGTGYATDRQDGTVTVFKGTTVVGRVDVGGQPFFVAVDPHGVAYVSLVSEGSLAVVEGTKLTKTLLPTVAASSVAVGPDGTVFAPDYRTGMMTIFENQGKLVRTIFVGRGAGYMAVAADGTLYVGLRDCSLAVIKNHEVVRTLDLGSCHEDPRVAVAPDGTVYVTLAPNVGHGELVVVKGTSIAGRVELGANPYGVAVATDGSIHVAENAENRIAVLRS